MPVYLSGQYILRPNSFVSGVWDDMTVTDIDDVIVRPTNAISNGDGQYAHNDDKSINAQAQWGVQDIPARDCTNVSGDIIIWTYTTGDIEVPPSANLRVNDVWYSGVSHALSDDVWKGFIFDFDGLNIESGVSDMGIGIYSPTLANGEYFNLYAAYVEVNYTRKVDHGNDVCGENCCLCPKHGYSEAASGACCYYAVDFKEQLISPCSEPYLETIGKKRVLCDGVPSGFFGSQVSLSSDGQTMAVSSSGYGLEKLRSGIVYAYSIDGADLIQKGGPISGVRDYENAGASIDLDYTGDTLVVGYPFESGLVSPFCRVFDYSDDTLSWFQRGNDIVQPDSSYQSGFGSCVSIHNSGNTFITGASNISSGYVFDWNGSDWTQRGLPISGVTGVIDYIAYHTEFFGVDVSIAPEDSGVIAICDSGACLVETFKWDDSSGRWLDLPYPIRLKNPTSVDLTYNGSGIIIGKPK